jgi:choline-sulfatase
MNVLFIVLDTVRRDAVAPFNEDIDHTEAIEALEDEGTVFTDAVAQAPWTLPSHGSMFTGLYPWEHGATQENLVLDVGQETLAERFREEGYATACYTENPWLSPHTGMVDGFEDVDNFFPVIPINRIPDRLLDLWKRADIGQHLRFMRVAERLGEFIPDILQERVGSRTESIIEKSGRFIREEDEFFLFINLMDAHLPMFPPEEYRQRHAPDVDPTEVCQVAHRHNGGKEEADFDALRKLYRAQIDYMDDKIGALLELLEEEGCREETVVVIASDHGQHLGEEGLLGHVFSVSEYLVSVPLVVDAPGLDEGLYDEQVELRELYDLLPGLAGLAEMPDIGSTYAKGGMAFPNMELAKLPEDRKPRFAHALQFVRGEGQKITRKIHREPSEQAGEVEDEAFRLESGETCEPDPDMVDELDEIDDRTGGGGRRDIEDEKVKKRLEDLGYF